MAGFLPRLILMMRVPDAALVAATALYFFARHFDSNFAASPSGSWYFNPFAWQLLSTMGAWATLGGAIRVPALARSRIVLSTSVAFVLFALVLTMATHFDRATFVPTELLGLFVPNDKTNLVPYRVRHFLALAAIVVRVVPRHWSGLHSPCCNR